MLVLAVVVAGVGTPIVGRGLESSLTISSGEATVPPELIFVLAGGYAPGATPDEDILSGETLRRLLHGVNLLQQYPHARLVLSGSGDDGSGVRGADRMGRLMVELAASKGVPASALILETRSRNTREHPTEALRLPGVTAATPIGIVTSSWHMRRADQEFRRHFRQVQPFPVPISAGPFRPGDLVPSAATLGGNTSLIREWVGLSWYRILRLRK